MRRLQRLLVSSQSHGHGADLDQERSSHRAVDVSELDKARLQLLERLRQRLVLQQVAQSQASARRNSRTAGELSACGSVANTNS